MDGRNGGSTDRRMVGWVVAVSAAMVAVMAYSSSANPAIRRSVDIHSEYVKFPSGKDTVTAYIAYPERPQPAPAVIVIHEILACRTSSGRRPSSSPRTA